MDKLQIIVVILLLVAVISALVIVISLPRQEVPLAGQAIIGEAVLGLDEDTEETIEELHWNHMPLTYKYEECSANRIKRVEEALKYISDEIEGISFLETGGEADIMFICTSKRKEAGYILGESQTSVYSGTNILSSARIVIYPAYHCLGRKPIVEIHETLHAFGLEHAPENSWNDIMNPFTMHCTAEISEKDKGYLQNIYQK